MGFGKIFLTSAVLLTVFSVTACDKPSSGLSVEREIPTGTYCTIQFLRDALGGSTNLPISPTTSSINGAKVAISGYMLEMNDEWIVLKTQTDGGNELWIPRRNVLLISLNERAE